MTFQAWLQQAIARLAESDSPRRDAEILLGHVTGRARTWILAFGETTLSADEAARLEALLVRRQRGEPIAHLVGQREFWSLPLFVSPATLIPRPDTECLVEQALARLPTAPCRILDLGTGTGAIALALASERPDCEVTAVDVMPDAVALALRNAEHLGIANVTISQSDWFSALAGQRFATIVSNPPYIPTGDLPGLDPSVRDYEPHMALDGGADGLDFYRAILRHWPAVLHPGSRLYFEVGIGQADDVLRLMRSVGFGDLEILPDPAGIPRVVLGALYQEI